jgi:transcription elongation factor Elf1
VTPNRWKWPPPRFDDPIKHVTCPECGNDKAVVAATNRSAMMCFCPVCEHAWDCEAIDTSIDQPGGEPV